MNFTVFVAPRSNVDAIILEQTSRFDVATVRPTCRAVQVRIDSEIRAGDSLPAFTDELFPQDIASMLKSRLTFKEAIESPDQSLMSRHRLKVAQREFYSRLDSLAV